MPERNVKSGGACYHLHQMAHSHINAQLLELASRFPVLWRIFAENDPTTIYTFFGFRHVNPALQAGLAFFWWMDKMIEPKPGAKKEQCRRLWPRCDRFNSGNDDVN